MLYLSAYFERHRDEYYRRLLGVSQRGMWIDWIRFFLTGVEARSQDTITRSDRLLTLWSGYRTKLQEARASSLLSSLVDRLFSSPVITTKKAAELLRVTQRSAQLNITKLIEADILDEATNQKRKRVYVAREIIAIVEQ